MVNLEVLFQELIKRKVHSKSIEFEAIEDGEVFRIALKDTQQFSLKDIAYESFKGIQFEDSINEELQLYKCGGIWRASKFRFISNNLMEYWIEKEMNTAEEFYDFIMEECKKSDDYYKEDWNSKLGLPDLYDLYEKKINKLEIDGWKLAYKYSEEDLINGHLNRETYYRTKENNTIEILEVYPPEGEVSNKNRKFFSDHTRWDIDSTYSWSDFYESYKKGKDLNEIFDIEILTKSEFLQELLNKDNKYTMCNKE